MEVLPTLLVRSVGRCGGRPGSGVAVDARSGGGRGSPFGPQRPPRWFETVRESLLDSYKNKSHKYPLRGRVLPNRKRGGVMGERYGLWPGVVALTGDADCYCVPCAMERYGEQVIQAVIDGGP